MTKRLFLTLTVLLSIALFGEAPAYAVYLDSGWRASVTDVQFGSMPGSYFHGIQSADSGFEIKVDQGTALFTVTRSGQYSAGIGASWFNTTLDERNTMGPIAFDYKTYWDQPNLSLVVETFCLQTMQFQTVWASSRIGTRAGHVLIDAHPNGYRLSLVVVPEPNGLIAFGSLVALGTAALRRRIA